MEPSLSPSQSVIGLDVGEVRIGVARANAIAKVPEPLDVVDNDADFQEKLNRLIFQHDTGVVVVGIPRNLSGEETKQSALIREFADRIKVGLSIPVVFVDESMSSRRADEYLAKHPKVNIGQDAIAACYILEEYFSNS